MPSTTADNQDHIRYEISQLEKMREQILADMETLRTQEDNLRQFEARLRESMPPWGHASRAPMGSGHGDSGALAAEWEKFQRSRALLEAERRALADEMIVLREEKTELQRRNDALKQREAWLEVREKEFAAKCAQPVPPPAPPRSVTLSPFIAAKNLLSLSRAS